MNNLENLINFSFVYAVKFVQKEELSLLLFCLVEGKTINGSTRFPTPFFFFISANKDNINSIIVNHDVFKKKY